MNQIRFDHIKGILCDIDGVIWDGQETRIPEPGAHEAIRYIKEVRKLPIRFVTNTTTRSLATLYKGIREGEFPIELEEIVSPPKLAAEFLRKLAIENDSVGGEGQRRQFKHGKPSVFLVMREDTETEFAEFPKDNERPDYIVIGNNKEKWDYALMDRLFHMLMHGSEMLALHKQRFWLSGGEIRIDIGAFVTALAFASGKRATAIGKPEPLFFKTALEEIGVKPEEALMIGDDIETDIGGAHKAGLMGVLVKTGKYREEYVRQSKVTPDLVIASLGELPEYL